MASSCKLEEPAHKKFVRVAGTDPCVMPTSVAQPLVEGRNFNKLQATSFKLDSD